MKKFLIMTICVLSLSVVGCNSSKTTEEEVAKESVTTNSQEVKSTEMKIEKDNLKNNVVFNQLLTTRTKNNENGDRVDNPDYVEGKTSSKVNITNNSDKVLTEIHVKHIYYNLDDKGRISTVKEEQIVKQSVNLKPGESISFVSSARQLIGEEGWHCELDGAYE